MPKPFTPAMLLMTAMQIMLRLWEKASASLLQLHQILHSAPKQIQKEKSQKTLS